VVEKNGNILKKRNESTGRASEFYHLAMSMLME
jgi:hypothetical protein